MLMELSLWEGQALVLIQEFVRQTVLDPLVCLYTRLGDGGMLWIVLCAVLLIFPKTRRAGLAGAAALLCSLLLTNMLIKPFVDRTRPWLILEELVPLVVENDPHSFPSGHTSAAFAASVAWAHFLPRRWMKITGIVMAALMGLSRLYVGVHVPSDVLCGMLAGLCCGVIGAYVVRKALWKSGKL